MTSIEFGHHFAGQRIGPDQIKSQQQVPAPAHDTTLVVLVDDYSAPKPWDAREVAEQFEDTEYQRAWELRRQIQLRKNYQQEQNEQAG